MSFRQLPKELQIVAENELNEVPSRVVEDIAKIREWISTQPHLNARTDDQWLLNFLRGCKFSLEKTKQKLDTYYTYKTLIQEVYGVRDPFDPNLQELLDIGVVLPLIDRSDPTRPIYWITRYCIDGERVRVYDMIKIVTMVTDVLLMEEDKFIINGYHHMDDLSDFSMPYLLQLSPTIMKQYVMCAQDGYPTRIKTIGIINLPGIFESMLKLTRLLLKEKMRNRMVVIKKEDIRSRIPRDLLPKEYGGEGPSTSEIAAEWKKKIESYRDWFIEDSNYRTDESKRPGKPKMISDMFGVEGSFRKLDID